MKKKEIRRRLNLQLERSMFREDHLCEENRMLRGQLRKITLEVEMMRKNWQPAPIPHRYVERKGKCAFCDEPEYADRHEVKS